MNTVYITSLWLFLIVFGMGLPVCVASALFTNTDNHQIVDGFLIFGMLAIAFDIGKVVVQQPPWKC